MDTPDSSQRAARVDAAENLRRALDEAAALHPPRRDTADAVMTVLAALFIVLALTSVVVGIARGAWWNALAWTVAGLWSGITILTLQRVTR